MSGGGPGLYRRGDVSDSTNLYVIMGFDEQQLLVQLSDRNLINRKGFILCHHSPVNANVLLSLFNAFNSKTFSRLSTSRRTAPARHVRPRHAHAPPVRPRRAAPHHAHVLGLGPARRGERARARVWFTDLLLPASQVVYTRSTL